MSNLIELGKHSIFNGRYSCNLSLSQIPKEVPGTGTKGNQITTIELDLVSYSPSICTKVHPYDFERIQDISYHNHERVGAHSFLLF